MFHFSTGSLVKSMEMDAFRMLQFNGNYHFYVQHNPFIKQLTENIRSTVSAATVTIQTGYNSPSNSTEGSETPKLEEPIKPEKPEDLIEELLQVGKKKIKEESITSPKASSIPRNSSNDNFR